MEMLDEPTLRGRGYCSEPANSTRRWRALDPKRVVEEARVLWDAYEPEVIDFMGPEFSADPKRVLHFVEEVERQEAVGLRFQGNMRARDIRLIERFMPVERLADAGWKRVFMGVESGSDRMLTKLKKGACVEDSIVACERLSAVGIEIYTSFMHDLPTERVEDSDRTMGLAARLARLPGNFQSHHFFTPYPGTEAHEEYFGNHLPVDLPQREWAESDTHCGTIVWRGRRRFREEVRRRLEGLKESHPSVFKLNRLPEP